MDFWGNSENHGVSKEEIYLLLPLRRGKVFLPRHTKMLWIYGNNSAKL